MSDLQQALEQVSLTTTGFASGDLLGDALQDWFRFLGGKPGKVVFVDMGSDSTAQRAYRALASKGWIDELRLRDPGGADTQMRKETAFVHEYLAYTLATTPYLLMVHLDTLPFRQGHAEWLPDALEFLDRPDVFAISGSFNLYCKHHDAWEGWYWSGKCSQNFALMKRERFLAATQEFMGDFIRSGFQGESPAHATGQDRYIIELAFEQYMMRHNLLTLIKHEDPTWTIFHTNIRGAAWHKTRADYLARKSISPYLDAGANPTLVQPGSALYYGQPRVGFVKQARIRLGQSLLGPPWRTVKQKLKLYF